MNVFDPADLDDVTGIRIRVECLPYARDHEHPIRLVLVDSDTDQELTELRFTPTRANDTADSIAELLGEFVPRLQISRLADGLRTAAIKVWAARN